MLESTPEFLSLFTSAFRPANRAFARPRYVRVASPRMPSPRMGDKEPRWPINRARPSPRLAATGHDVVVSTKVGRLVHAVTEREQGDIFLGAPPGTAVFDYSADGVRRSFAASCERLQRARRASDDDNIVLRHATCSANSFYAVDEGSTGNIRVLYLRPG